MISRSLKNGFSAGIKLLNDYVYMRTNNAIISNNQSKDLIALWCLHVKSKALHSRLHAVSIILIIR